jgi:hypothetical protein
MRSKKEDQKEKAEGEHTAQGQGNPPPSLFSLSLRQDDKKKLQKPQNPVLDTPFHLVKALSQRYGCVRNTTTTLEKWRSKEKNRFVVITQRLALRFKRHRKTLPTPTRAGKFS